MKTTTKRRLLMHLTQQGTMLQPAEFESDVGSATTRVVMPTAEWYHMSRPTIITVTFEPGDLLNA